MFSLIHQFNLPFRALCFATACVLLTLDAAQSAQDHSLAEARAIGIKQSSYRNQTPTTAKNPKQDLTGFNNRIKPILKKACADCHGADAQEGNVRIDTLNPNLIEGKDVDWWLEVLAVLTNGEMPPPEEGLLADDDRAKVIDWLSNEIQVASTIKRATAEHSSFRRMTRYEFNYALQDILGLPYDFARDLPPEANSEDGFQNSSELLHMSVSQLETYRRIARQALLRATVRGERPPVLHWAINMKDARRIDWQKQQKKYDEAKARAEEKDNNQQLTKRFHQPHGAPYYKDLTTGRTVRASWGYGGAKHAFKPIDKQTDPSEPLDSVAILPRGRSRLTVELGNRVPDEGIMRVRVRASRLETSSRVPSMQLYFGWQASNEGRAVMRVSKQDTRITALPEQPEFYQWDVPLGDIYPRNSVRKTSKMGSMPNPSEYLRLANSSASSADIQLDYVEVSAPVYDEWPPHSHKRIFIESKNQSDETKYAREILVAFMSKAWRRSINDNEVKQKIKLFGSMRKACDSFEETMVEVLATVLASPNFLYVARNESGSRDLAGSELATRLSLFLWCSVPDEQLLELASTGTLKEPNVLAEQADRLLAAPRSHRLAEHFVHQWLDMQLLDFLNFERSFDPLLKEAMQREPIAMFEEMIRTDASVLDFIHADYTLANERLAGHYGLKEVRGNELRRVNLAENPRRGGLLTQAGLLAMNSAGEDSHPLKRGVWLLESLLNDPPPPPPPAVPEIDLADPEIAKMTLKEQIEDHRNHAACMSCHAKIDPWGIAFENYDARGRGRNQVKGKPVDATSTLFNDQKLNGMPGLKRFLLKNRQDQFVRAMVHKLTIYALGRPLTFADRSSVDAITAEVRKRGDGLATMIKLIATSELFRSK